MKKNIIKLNLVICACAMVFSGCTKKQAEYTNNTKFKYTDVQEGEKKITDTKDDTSQAVAMDSLGDEESGNGVTQLEMGDGQTAIIQQPEMIEPEMPDDTLEDLENFTSGESEEDSTESTEEESFDDPENPDSGFQTIETDETPQTTETTGDTSQSTTPEETTNSQVEDIPEETIPTTEAPGSESGSGQGTEQTQTTESQNPSDGQNGDSGDQGNNENLPGDSTPSDAGTGESGTGQTGGGDSGSGDAGGNNSGDNGAGTGDTGNGGSGDGGNGDGGDGALGGDEPTKPGVGKNPDEVVRIWYEGTLGNYIWGEAVDKSKLKVYAEFGDGSTKEVEAYSVNMNYPERYVASEKKMFSFPKTYDPGVYQATISYENAQIECPYNLIALFIMVTDVYYGSCKDPEGHNALLRKKEEFTNVQFPFDIYLCDETHDCFYWKIESDGGKSVGISNHEIYYFPVYYDYTYTIEDLKSDNYYANVYFDIDSATIVGNAATIYKNSVITDKYYAYAYSHDISIWHDNIDILKEKMIENHSKW